MTLWDTLWTGANLATMSTDAGPYGMVPDGALAVSDGRIAWIGPQDSLPGEPDGLAAQVSDLEGAWITPGLIDCHTHLVFGGDRGDEFERRLGGASYEEIARGGGGILSTVRATRDADEAVLTEGADLRARHLLEGGVTTLEIKSGYGLDTGTELKMLRVARALGERLPVDVRTTFLGAHALPPKFATRRGDYVALVCDEMIPRVVEEGLADMVDAFCEGFAFSVGECEQILDAGRSVGLAARLHADQLSDTGGAALAARVGALSADHLEYASADGVRSMAEAGTVAVLLPGAFHFLRESRPPPVEAFRENGVPMALASDCNPGSSPVLSLQLMISMGCTHFGLTPEEALAAVTRNAARALGLHDRGVLELGRRADLAFWRIGHPRDLAYWMGGTRPFGVVRAGESVVI